MGKFSSIPISNPRYLRLRLWFSKIPYYIIICCCSIRVPTIDTKCASDECCWYCKGVCHSCLHASSFGPGLSATSSSGIPLFFCSQSCANVFVGNKHPLKLNISLFKRHNVDSSKDNDLLLISGDGFLKEDEGVLVHCTLKLGDFSEEYPSGRYIVLCQLRSLFNQRIREVFVTKECIPECELPHARDDNEKFTEPEFVTQILLTCLETIRDAFYQRCKVHVPLNLDALLTFQTQLFESDASADVLKVRYQELDFSILPTEIVFFV